MFPSFWLELRLLRKASGDLPKPAAVQGLADADQVAGRSLASLARVQSAGSHVCSKTHADSMQEKLQTQNEMFSFEKMEFSFSEGCCAGESFAGHLLSEKPDRPSEA